MIIKTSLRDIVIPDEYEFREKEYLKSLGGDCVILSHRKTGARVALMVCSDENKSFGIAFATPPTDNTGVPHIIEHTVLCGSEKYPVKDPFMTMDKTSVNTFLNAMTYPDKTYYPISSCNYKDFINLSNVYLDAVFAPLFLKKEEIFMQEGWHYDLSKEEWDINGIVYSEMKGTESSPDSLIEEALCRALFVSSPYRYDSGGVSEDIPSLTYEKYKDYYLSHYSAQNAYICLYGNIDFEERLRYIDENYLSKDSVSGKKYETDVQPPVGDEIKEETFVYPSTDEEADEYFSFASVVSDASDPAEMLMWEILSDILIDSTNGIIKQKLIESGICRDVFGGINDEIRQPYFSVIARGVKKEDKDRFLRIISDTVGELIKNKLNKKTLSSRIERLAFSLAEGSQNTESKGIVLFENMLGSWMYYDNDPMRNIRYFDILDEVRIRLENGGFEELLRKFSESKIKAFVYARPDRNLPAENERKTKEKIVKYRSSLSSEELKTEEEKYRRFVMFQESEDSEENLRSIPKLSKSDLDRDRKFFFIREENEAFGKTVYHDIESNGIAYISIGFDISSLSAEEHNILCFLKPFLGRLDTEEYDRNTLEDEINLCAGGFGFKSTYLQTQSEPFEIKQRVIFTLKAFPDRLKKALDLFLNVALKTDFSDRAKMKELLDAEVNDTKINISRYGSFYASLRAASCVSAVSSARENASGLSAYFRMKDVLDNFDDKIDSVTETLKKAFSRIFVRDNYEISICADEDIMDKAKEFCSLLSLSLPEKPCGDGEGYVPVPRGAVNEAVITQSKVQYVGIVSCPRGIDYRDGSLRVLSYLIKNDLLYPEIRVKGGAYGYSYSLRDIGPTETFVTYRDPNLKESIDVFRSIPDYAGSADADGEELDGMIVSCVGKGDVPRTPAMKASESYEAYLLGIDDEEMNRRRADALDCTAEKIRSFAEPLKKANDSFVLCVVGSENKIKDNEKLFDRIITI